MRESLDGQLTASQSVGYQVVLLLDHAELVVRPSHGDCAWPEWKFNRVVEERLRLGLGKTNRRVLSVDFERLDQLGY